MSAPGDKFTVFDWRRTVTALVCPTATPKTQGLWELSCLEDRDHQKMALV